MSFKFFKNGKEVNPPARVKWSFVGKPESIFESSPDKLDVNVKFWRNKLELSADTTYEIHETDGYKLNLPTAKITKEDDEPTLPSTDNLNNITSNNGPDLESDISESTEANIDSAKPKRRKKAMELPDLSAELDNTTSTDAE